jgi:hypothetical protein
MGVDTTELIELIVRRDEAMQPQEIGETP